jgi:starch phosphorylase
MSTQGVETKEGVKASNDPAAAVPMTLDQLSMLRDQYGCGPVQLYGGPTALYERHLVFDKVVSPADADARVQFEAIARAVRDVLSQRWIKTEQTYKSENPKRAYYLSMEFLIGRSLNNNITNLLLATLAEQAVRQKKIDLIELLEQEPDPGLGHCGRRRLAAFFLDSMATLQRPAMGYGLRYEYGIFKQSIRNGWQAEQPDNWLRNADPWEVPRPNDAVEIKINCSFELRDGRLNVIRGEPSALIGIPYDRPVVGYGGENINTLRLWAEAAPNFFYFQRLRSSDFVAALAGSPLNPSRVLILTTPQTGDRHCGFSRSTGCCLLADRVLPPARIIGPRSR